MRTAKAMGFVKGDFAIDREFGFIHKLIQGLNTATPLCEVWGFEHEFGSAYAENLTKISEEEARQLISERG